MNQSAVVPRLDLVGGRPVTTSLNVAEVFGKQHRNVVRAVQSLDVPDEFSALNFELASYVDAQGKPRPMYNITRDGFTLLAMGFTGKAAMQFKLAYIEAFNRMEAELSQPAGKRSDIYHHRGPLSDSGLDIRYTLDLTKIVHRPTAKSLGVLQRVTGVDMADLIDALDHPAAAHTDHIRTFSELALVRSIGDRVLFSAFFDAMRQWAFIIDDTTVRIHSRQVATDLRSLGYELEKRGGRIWIIDCVLVEVEA